MGERREGTCDRGQVRGGTRFALDEDEVSLNVRMSVNTNALLGEASREMLELASQALSSSNDNIFNLFLVFLSRLRTLEPAFSDMQVTRPILWGSSSAHDV